MPNNIGLRATRRLSGRMNAAGGASFTGLFYNFAELTTSGTSTDLIPSSAVLWRIQNKGSGGGGGQGNGSTGGGAGGSGGLSDTGLVAGDGSAKTVVITVGAGGAGGNTGVTGGATTLTVGTFTLTSYGGGGGASGDSGGYGGWGGAAVGGNINLVGSTGESQQVGGGGVSGPGGSGYSRNAPRTRTSKTFTLVGVSGDNGGALVEWWTRA